MYLKNLIQVSAFLIIIALFSSCSHRITSSSSSLEKWINQNDSLKNSFHGYAIYNLSTQKMLAKYHDEKLFTPASNTKILTFFAALKTLPQKLPVAYYAIGNDTLYIKGNGNPAFLYLNDSSLIGLIQSFPEQVVFTDENSSTNPLGNGWMWQDITEKYSPEITSLPIASNLLSIRQNRQGVSVFPTIFQSKLSFLSTRKEPFRKWHSNEFVIDTSIKKSVDIPYITSPTLTSSILSELTNRTVLYQSNTGKLSGWLPFGSFDRDSILKPMMHDSDNFLAEQTLWLIGAHLHPYQHFDSDSTLNYIQKNYFTAYYPKPKWVDGSGLSRYNLISPHFLIALLKDMYAEHNKKSLEGLLSFFPKAGVSGTLKNIGFYPPTTYAKTGTLSNNHNLSGYLITKKGTPLCFSFMNNHYTIETNAIRKEMSKVLWELYNRY